MIRAVNVTLLPSSDGKTALSLPWGHLGETSPGPHRTMLWLPTTLFAHGAPSQERPRERTVLDLEEGNLNWM